MILRIDKNMARVIARSTFWDVMTDEEKNDDTLLKRLLIMKRKIRKKLGETMTGEYTSTLRPKWRGGSWNRNGTFWSADK